MIVHATEHALSVVRGHRNFVGDHAPTQFLKAIPFDEWPIKLKEFLPNASFDLVRNESSNIGAIILLHARQRVAATDRSGRTENLRSTEMPR
jgi:sigma-54 dependent transcriptional regulator, acetoin dehydrogenase operon transcriptional activator AcoR